MTSTDPTPPASPPPSPSDSPAPQPRSGPAGPPASALRLKVRSVADLIAFVPYLLGFHPTDSLVIVAMRHRRVIFGARADLPGPRSSVIEIVGAADQLAEIVARQRARAVTVLGYGPEDQVNRIMGATRKSLACAGLEVLDALRITGDRYWSYTCQSPDCCPPEGTPFDLTTSEVTAEAALAGEVAFPDRTALARSVAPIGGLTRVSMRQATDRAAEELAELIRAAPSSDLLAGRAVREAGEAAVKAALGRYRRRASFSGGEQESLDRRRAEWLTDDEMAWLTLLLSHIPVRDFAWEHTGSAEWHLALWTDALRRAELELVPAPASLLAFAAWRSGNGPLARVAVERALHADPSYSFALLIDDVLCSGVDPSRLDGWPEMRGADKPPGRGKRRKQGKHAAPTGTDGRGGRDRKIKA